MRAPGLCNTLSFPLLLLLLLLAFTAGAKQSKVSPARSKLSSSRGQQQQQLKAREQLIGPPRHGKEEFDGLPGEVEYDVDLSDQARIAAAGEQLPEQEPQVTWISR